MFHVEQASPEELLRGPPADDVIVALATPPGRGAVAIVRGSGPPDAVRRVFGGLVGELPTDRRAALRTIVVAGQELDEALVLRFCAPRSYTGQEVVELHLHGNPRLAERVLGALIDAGGRAAAPGEFTRRAVASSRMTLLQAEAVDALVRAQTAGAAAMARRQLGGGLSREVAAWRRELLGIAAALEAAVDFPDEVDDAELAPLLDAAADLAERLARLEEAQAGGRAALEGARVALVGPVNAGKSTLFNALLGQDRALVSEHPGTTRDVVSELAHWGGHAVRLEDTAGEREADDVVERAGIERGRRAVAEADVRLEVRCASEILATGCQAPVGALAVATHGDLLTAGEASCLQASGWLVTAAPTGVGIEALQAAIVRDLGARPLPDWILHTERQRRALRGCVAALKRAAGHGLAEPVLAALEVRQAGQSVEELGGRWLSEEVLDEVFERFCIGK